MAAEDSRRGKGAALQEIVGERNVGQELDSIDGRQQQKTQRVKRPKRRYSPFLAPVQAG